MSNAKQLQLKYLAAVFGWLAVGCLPQVDSVAQWGTPTGTTTKLDTDSFPQCEGDSCACEPGPAPCDLACTRPPCDLTCEPRRECKFGCVGFGCDITCKREAVCISACTRGFQRSDKGECEVFCERAASCHHFCPDGRCVQVCAEGATCILDCPGGDCTLKCKDSEQCEIRKCESGSRVLCGGSASCDNSCTDEESGCELIMNDGHTFEATTGESSDSM